MGHQDRATKKQGERMKFIGLDNGVQMFPLSPARIGFHSWCWSALFVSSTKIYSRRKARQNKIQFYLGISANLYYAFLWVEFPQASCPRSSCSDVQTEQVFMGSRCQSERMVLVGPQWQTCNPYPLSRPVVKILGSLELQVGDPWINGEKKSTCYERPNQQYYSQLSVDKQITDKTDLN